MDDATRPTYSLEELREIRDAVSPLLDTILESERKFDLRVKGMTIHYKWSKPMNPIDLSPLAESADPFLVEHLVLQLISELEKKDG